MRLRSLFRRRGIPTTLTRLEVFAARRNAQVSISLPESSGGGHLPVWAVAIEWGREAPDSPMIGAAAYGMDEDLDYAITQALDEAGAP